MWQLLLVFLLVTIVIFYINFRWKRQSLYRLMDQLPGPKGLPLIGNALDLATDNQAIIRKIEHWNKMYPSPFRVWLGPEPMVAFTKPQDIQILLSGVAGLNKAHMFATLFRSFLGDGLLASDEIKWKPRRKLILKTFNPKILETFMPIFNEQNRILVQCMKQEVNKPQFEVWNYISKVALDTLCESAMGIKPRSQIETNEYLEASKRILKLITIRMLRVWLHPNISFHLSPYGKQFRTNKKVMSNFTQNVILEKQKMLIDGKFNNNLEYNFSTEMFSRGKAFLDFILELTQNNSDIKLEDIEEEVNTILIAGYDTTAITNCFNLLSIALHQGVQEKIYNELTNIFGDSDRDVDVDDLQRMQYLEMVIKESLRLYPTVYVFFRRLTTNLQLENAIVPKEATCCVGVKLLHTDPEIWPDPLKFDPNRFLPEEIAKRHPYSYIPFAAGPRNCIGYKYAMMSMKTLLATVLRAYHISTDLSDIEIDLTNTLQTTHGWLIKIQDRKSYQTKMSKKD